MYSACPLAFAGTPWDGLAQGPIHLENAGTVTVSLEFATERRRKVFAAHGKELPGRHIEKNWVAQTLKRVNGCVGSDDASRFLQASPERIRDRLRASLGNRPADCVSCYSKHQPEGGGHR